MTVQDALRRITKALEAAGIPYMLTGSFASSTHGAPRATQDIDFVIAPTADQLRRLASLLPSDSYYINLDAALEALKQESQFNVIDSTTAWKIDFIVRKSRPFSREEFDRRRPVEIEGIPAYIATAEDIVIAKLEWAKLGSSQRQLEDVAAIIRARPTLDSEYIDTWVKNLGLQAEWTSAALLARRVE